VTAADALDAWHELLDALRASGDAVGALASTTSETDVAEGLRYVLHALGDQLDRAALRDSASPVLLPAITPVRKLFFDNPDTDYDTALIRGDHDYRIHGTRGTSAYFAICAYAGDPRRGQATRVTNLHDTDMVFAADGSFEVTLSARPHGGNWIELAPDSHAVFVRQYFLDRARETPARYAIESRGESAPDPALDARRFARVARGAAAFVPMATTLAVDRVDRARAATNRFVEVPGHGVYGTPDAGYVACWYHLAPDEMLVVAARPPECRYWGVHLANRWGQSLDHRTRPTVWNSRTATPEADGSYRFAIARADPGVHNWLDTAGHDEGWALFRWLLADEVVVPSATVQRVTRAQRT
jgi:hypothetical protein